MRWQDNKGYSFVEVMVTVAIVAMMAAGGFAALSAGQASWFTSEASIQVQESLRQSLEKVTTELRESKYSLVTLTAGGGYNGTDIIKFSIPVICHTGDNLLDGNGDMAHWGATLTWNCRDPLCMDLDNNCATVEYKYIQYEVIAGNKLVRKVLDNVNAQKAISTVANNVADFKVVMPGAASPVTITLKAQVTSVLKRPVIVTVTNNIVFRNK